MYRFPDPLDEDSLKPLVADERYGDSSHPEHPFYRKFVDRAFALVYPDPPRDGAGNFVIDPRDPPKPQVITGGAEFRPYENNEPFNGPEDRVARNDSDERDAFSLGGTGDIAQSTGSQNIPPDPLLGNNDPDQSSDARRQGFGSALNTTPLPKMHPPAAGPLTIRRDPYGGGMRGDPRTRKDKTTGNIIEYDHEGTDVVAKAGKDVLSPANGLITRVEVDPYGDGRFTGIEIVTDDGRVVRLSYAAAHATVKPGQRVSAGSSIGKVQDRAASRKGMVNHIHIEVWERKDGKPAAARKGGYGKNDLSRDFIARDPWLAFQ